MPARQNDPTRYGPKSRPQWKAATPQMASNMPTTSGFTRPNLSPITLRVSRKGSNSRLGKFKAIRDAGKAVPQYRRCCAGKNRAVKNPGPRLGKGAERRTSLLPGEHAAAGILVPERLQALYDSKANRANRPPLLAIRQSQAASIEVRFVPLRFDNLAAPAGGCASRERMGRRGSLPKRRPRDAFVTQNKGLDHLQGDREFASRANSARSHQD